MTEEKIRNYKLATSDMAANDSIPSFLLKTYEILQNQKYADIICWTKNGEGFVVKKVKQFAENVLPTHFRHSNYTSFVRQLNMYDFHKTRQENQENAFKNSLFKRGQKHLLKEIQRKDYKKKKERNEVNEKIGVLLTENEIKEGKKGQHQKEFYLKGLEVIQRIDSEMSYKQNQLAKIDEISLVNMISCESGLADLLDFLVSIKISNTQWSNNLLGLGKDWQNMLNNKKQNIKVDQQDQKADENKKNTAGTLATFNSFSHHR